VPARRRGGRGRFGEIRCVDGLPHALHDPLPERRIDQTSSVRKGFNEKSNDARGIIRLKSAVRGGARFRPPLVDEADGAHAHGA
jgi:hypothetical protein